jgi:hypothetical protein
MKQTLTKQNFIDAFNNSYRKDNFSYQGLEKLFDYFEQFEEETGEQIELDIIAICCDFTEYENINELKKEYEIPSNLSNDKIIEYLNERTQVICFEKNCILIQRY